MKSQRARVAGIFSNLSAMFHDQGELYEALAYLKRAAVIYRERVRDGDTSLRPALAKTLTDIAELLLNLDLPSESGLTIEESLRLYNELVEEHPESFVEEINAARALQVRLGK